MIEFVLGLIIGFAIGSGVTYFLFLRKLIKGAVSFTENVLGFKDE